jgi:hypothetical protein
MAGVQRPGRLSLERSRSDDLGTFRERTCHASCNPWNCCWQSIDDQVPKLNVEATCKGSVAADKAMGLMLPQGFDKCMSDENSAQQQLVPIWSSYSAAIRAQCEGEATAAGSASFSAMCGMSFLLWAKAADKSRSETTLRKGLSP